MAFTLDAPETLAGESTMLMEPGVYHFVVTGVFEGKRPPKSNGEDGSMLKNGGFSFAAEVVNGPQQGKRCNMIFNNGDLSQKDKGEFARKRQAAALIACDCLKPSDLGKKVDIDLASAEGAQLIGKVHLGNPFEIKDDDGNAKSIQQMELEFANIYHIDDPRVGKVEKDAAAIASIPKECRRTAEYFEPLTKRKAAAAKPEQTKKIDDSEFDSL